VLALPTEEKEYRTVVEKRLHHSPIQHPIKTSNKDAPIEHIIRLEDPTNHTRLYIVKATLKHTDGCWFIDTRLQHRNECEPNQYIGSIPTP
jgi:hypothetical protein